ncbi:uncharacterized protein LOC131336379 isoform X3 [Rhododendron vialii]|uniref:uncharacterized protein LOC131336379 isoform X3 n=1 Tax=Rhododendron vialii TaxID=182163 RepID=UPI00266053DA|nr:uncharacterized protein LOC131336379 isoform X3 [Rhododendron vialii]
MSWTMEEFKLEKETCLEDENISNWQENQVNSDSDASFVDCEMPELAIFELESEYQIVKDICIDREIPSPARCSVENYFLSEHVKHCDSNEDSTCSRLPLVAEFYAHISNSNGDRVEPKYNKVPIEGSISTATESDQVEAGSITYDCGPSLSTINTGNKEIPGITEDHKQSSYAAPGPVLGPITKSGSISFRSNSCNSTRSFTFPVLAWEWNDSPERMVEAKRKVFKKHRRWKSVVSLCCKF